VLYSRWCFIDNAAIIAAHDGANMKRRVLALSVLLLTGLLLFAGCSTHPPAGTHPPSIGSALNYSDYASFVRRLKTASCDVSSSAISARLYGSLSNFREVVASQPVADPMTFPSLWGGDLAEEDPILAERFPALLAGLCLEPGESYYQLPIVLTMGGFTASAFSRYDRLLCGRGSISAWMLQESMDPGEIERLEASVRTLSGDDLYLVGKAGLSCLIRLCGVKEAQKRVSQLVRPVGREGESDARAGCYGPSDRRSSLYAGDIRVVLAEALADVGGPDALEALGSIVCELARESAGSPEWRCVPEWNEDSVRFACVSLGRERADNLVMAAGAFARAGGCDGLIPTARTALARALLDPASCDPRLKIPLGGYDFVALAGERMSGESRPWAQVPTPAALSALVARHDKILTHLALGDAQGRFPPDVIARCWAEAMAHASTRNEFDDLIFVLGSLHSPAALPELVAAAGRYSEWCIESEDILLVLSRIGGPEALDAMLALCRRLPRDKEMDRSISRMFRFAAGDDDLRSRAEVEPDPAIRAVLEEALADTLKYSLTESSPLALLAFLPTMLAEGEVRDELDVEFLAESLSANPSVCPRAVAVLREYVKTAPPEAVGDASVLLAVLDPASAEIVASAFRRAIGSKAPEPVLKNIALALGIAGREEGAPALVEALVGVGADSVLTILDALGAIGRPAVKAAVRGLDSDSAITRAYCAFFLGITGKETRPDLLRALKRECDPEATVALLNALTGLDVGSPGTFAVPYLASQNVAVRRSAARALFFHPLTASADVLSQLAKKDADTGVRALACNALSRLPCEPALGTLLEVEQDGSPDLSATAFLLLSVREDCPAGPVIRRLEAICSIGGEDAIRNELKDERVAGCLFAALHACALRKWPEALPMLDRMACDEIAGAFGSEEMGDLIIALHSYAAEGVPALERLLHIYGHRSSAACALRNIGGGTAGRALEQCFREGLADGSNSTAVPLAFWAMHGIDAEYSEEIWLARAHYALTIGSTDAMYSLARAAFLAPFRGAAPDLVQMIAHGDGHVARYAALALAQTGDSKGAVGLLASKDPVVLASALLVLAANPDRSVLDAVGALADHPDPTVRSRACLALVAGGDAPAAAPFLQRTLAETDWKKIYSVPFPDDGGLGPELPWQCVPDNAALFAATMLPDPLLAPPLVRIAGEGNLDALLALLRIDAPEALAYAASGSFPAAGEAHAEWFPVLYISRYGGLAEADILISYIESKADPIPDSEYETDLLRAAIAGLERITGSSCGYDAKAWREAVGLARAR